MGQLRVAVENAISFVQANFAVKVEEKLEVDAVEKEV
jgi:hypothetical protein